MIFDSGKVHIKLAIFNVQSSPLIPPRENLCPLSRYYLSLIPQILVASKILFVSSYIFILDISYKENYYNR
jgi:hypothetical protein